MVVPTHLSRGSIPWPLEVTWVAHAYGGASSWPGGLEEGRGRGYWPLEISCMKWDSVVVLCVCVCLLLWRRIYLAFIWVYSLVLISIWRHNRQSLCHTMPFSTSRVGQTRRGSKWLSCEVGVKCIKGRVRGKESGGQDARCEGMLGMRNSRFYSEVWPYSYTGFFLSLSCAGI